jgi:pimeloyl-ACP methyl ester carboxylesterase
MKEKARVTGRLPGSALALFLLLSASAVLSGCGGPGPGEAVYTVEQGGITIGSQTVSVSGDESGYEYTGVERRPFQVYPASTSRKLKLSPDRSGLVAYYAKTGVPGASYRTYVSRAGNTYSFLADRLQTFDYLPALTDARRLLPLESDSVCLLQALCDRFIASGFAQARALVVVPSTGGVLRDVLVERAGEGRVSVSGPGIPDLDLRLDGSGTLSLVEGGGLTMTKVGSAGKQSSEPFAPAGRARAVKEVMVPVTKGEGGSGPLELTGSLYIPSGESPYPAVILAGGLGPQDRTGGGLLSQFAERLVGEGMAVLVCDRRGVPESEGEFATYTRQTAFLDLNAQVDYLVLRGDIDVERISIVGYDEGGQLAAAVASVNPYVSSLVLVATPSVRLFPELPWIQAEVALASGIITPEEADARRACVQNQELTLSEQSSEYADIEGHRLFLGWMRSQEESDPLAPLSSLRIPVLVVQGGRDASVAPAMAERIMESLTARPDGEEELALFEELGHDLGPLLTEAASVPYRAHPEVDPELLEKVSSWMKK